MKKGLFVSIEGPIGVGKTTLSNILTEHFQFENLKEIVEENPFLSKFYENIEEYALQTEAFFLFNRVKQLEDLEKKINNGVGIVSDYHIIKNLIFAKLTLNEKEFNRYRKVFDIFVDDLVQPDVIIYLNANVETLMKRIALRDRLFERQMDMGYIRNLSNEYERYFDNLQESSAFSGKKPILVKIDNSNLDIIGDAEAKEFVIKKVDSAIKNRYIIT